MATNINPELPPDSTERALSILRGGTASVEGIFPLGSNATFLCRMQSPLGDLRAVYKPARGERPLWDFPPGSLGRREAAAFEVSRAIGWNFVPPTVFRLDGPLGAGSFQEYLTLDPQENYFTLRETEPEALRRTAAFDVLINNADRKAMHVVRDAAGRVRLIDHGVCFHSEFKLRTVIWDYAGETLPAAVQTAIQDFGRALREADGIRAALCALLDPAEIDALAARCEALAQSGKYPEPGPGWNVPWPIWV